MLSKLMAIGKRTEVMDTIMVGAATLFGSFFSYLLQFVLGRTLSVEDYGTFNALLSLSSLVGVFAGAFGTALIKSVAGMYAKKEADKLSCLFIKSVNFSLVVGLAVSLVIFILSKFISIHMNIGDVLLVSIFGATVGLGFLNVVPNSYLQGIQEFKKYSIFHIVSLLIRFIFPVAFVFAGLGLRGVFSAFPISIILSFLIGFLMLKINLKITKRTDLSKKFKEIFTFGASVVLVNFSMMAFSNMDLILVKKYFSPVDAGYYAGTMTLGKILLFGAGAVSVVMFPKITALYTNGLYFMGRLKKLLLLLVSVLILGVLCYQIFPSFITHLFFGKAFEESVKYLPLFSVFVAMYVLVHFLVMFFLAVDKKKVGFLLLPGVLIQFILLNIFHDSLWDVIMVNIAVTVLVLLLLSVYFYFSIPKLKKTDIEKFKGVDDILDIGISPDRG